MIFTITFLRKNSSMVILFGLLLAMAGLLWFGIIPLNQTITDRMRGIQEYYAGQENREKQVGRLPELQNQFNTVTENEPLLNILISQDQIVDFIKTLEDIAQEMKVQMTIASQEGGKIIESKKVPAKVPIQKSDGTEVPTDNAPQSKVVNIVDDVPFDRYLRLNITVDGQYSNIVGFLRKTETLPVGLDVVGVDIRKIDATGKNTASIPTTGNPFTFLGGSTIYTQKSPTSVEDGTLEATFDILVYVDK